MLPNENYAVAAKRLSKKEEPDDFPSPPWSVRALCEKILLKKRGNISGKVWEPACGRGYMAETLKEYFEVVYATDKFEYGYGGVQDFLNSSSFQKVEWIITNPPYKHAEEFISQARMLARHGVAMLVRTSFLESVGRYDRLFSKHPPCFIAQFSERVPMVKGRIDKNASTATSYCWLVWWNEVPVHCSHLVIDKSSEFVWIPPCRKELEFDSDYPQT